MHPCAALLEEAVAMIPREEKALADEDVDRAEELAGERSELIRQAWGAREGYDEEALKGYLLRIKEANGRLKGVAEELHAVFRARQRAGRKQTRYFNTDRHIQSQLQRSFYCDKIS